MIKGNLEPPDFQEPVNTFLFANAYIRKKISLPKIKDLDLDSYIIKVYDE
jgi:hypothetical protein